MLARLKKIAQSSTSQNLLLEYIAELEAEERIKKLGKGNITLTTAAFCERAATEVIAKPILDGIFAFHKAVGGLKGHTITHVTSGEPLATGKETDIKLAVAYLIENVAVGDISDARNTVGRDFMRAQTEATLDMLRTAHKIARGVQA